MKEKDENNRSGKGTQEGTVKNQSKTGKDSNQKSQPSKNTEKGKSSK